LGKYKNGALNMLEPSKLSLSLLMTTDNRRVCDTMWSQN